MQNQKFCQIPSHLRKQITYICTFKECQYAFRWVCEECQRQQMHQHQTRQFSFLISLDRFSNYLNRLPEIQFLQIQLDTIGKLINDLKREFDTIYNLAQFKKFCQQYVESNNISQLSDQQLNSLLNIDRNSKSYIQIQNRIESMIFQLQNLNQQNIQFEMIHHQDSLIRDMQYPTISQNEKYLGFSNIYHRQNYGQGYDQINLNIRSLSTNRCLNQRQAMRKIRFIIFSINSKCILTYDSQSYINYFNMRSSLKLLFRIKISEKNQQNYYHKDIADFIWIDNSQILIYASHIIIFDIFKKRVMLRFYVFRVAIEYDRVNHLIITSDKNRIYFYERNTGNNIYQYDTCKKDDIRQIQLINQSQNLITGHIKILRLWRIDHENKKLDMIKYFRCQVFYFQSVYSDKLVIIRNIDQIIIIDNKFKQLYEQEIKCSEFKVQERIQQFMSSNYVIIRDEDSQSIILKNKYTRI